MFVAQNFYEWLKKRDKIVEHVFDTFKCPRCGATYNDQGNRAPEKMRCKTCGVEMKKAGEVK
jgi:tRNA(Ile2) C34 agmatinyltransferase TiaS